LCYRPAAAACLHAQAVAATADCLVPARPGGGGDLPVCPGDGASLPAREGSGMF